MKNSLIVYLVFGLLYGSGLPVKGQGNIGGGVTSGPINGNPSVTSLPGLTGVGTITTGTWNGTPITGLFLAANTGFGNTALQVCHAQYNFTNDGGGAPGLITPVNNCTLPANSVITNAAISWTTPATGALNTTSIGVTGTGGGPAKLLGATAVASLTGTVQGAILPSVASGWTKITTSGAITLTTAVAALSGGICEIYVFYFVSST